MTASFIFLAITVIYLVFGAYKYDKTWSAIDIIMFVAGGVGLTVISVLALSGRL